MPIIISENAKILPHLFIGTISPKPVVEIVIIEKYKASKGLSIT